MTKLYYTSATGCDSPYIRAFANGIHDLECEQVDLVEHTTMQGVNFYSINSKGTAPCLVLNDGSVISDKCTVLNYIELHHSGPAPEHYNTEINPEDDHHHHHSVRHRAHTVLSMVKSILPQDYHHRHHSSAHVSTHHHHHSIIHKLKQCIHLRPMCSGHGDEEVHEVECPMSPLSPC